MDVVGSNRTFEDIYLVGGADLADDVPKPVAYVIFEDFLSVFGSPDNVVFAVVHCVGGAVVACHMCMYYTTLKASA